MNISKYIILFCFPLVLACNTNAIDNGGTSGSIRIMFYNAENYFDIYNDSLTNDDEFLPNSDKQWDEYKFKQKTQQLFKVIAAVGEEKPPEIIALAEIENRYVLEQLVNNTYLTKYPFQIAHFESPDKRGIDVGLLYRSDVLELVFSEAIDIQFPDNPNKRTRDILYCKLLTKSSDTLYVFLNHWPSRMGGKARSAPNRIHVAKMLRNKVDSIFLQNPKANIIITGDFNDEPADISLSEGLGALPPDNIMDGNLYNLSIPLMESCKCGTYRFRAHWNMIDQFIVSGALLNMQNGINTCKMCAKIADFDFLLQDDTRYGGQKPYRTYLGPVYKGGVSDHLPIFLDITIK